MYLHLGCGSHRLPEPWKNYDAEVDIRWRLPFEDGSARYILAEHVIEHVPFSNGLSFLRECYRVLASGGVLRLSFPDIAKLDVSNAHLYREHLRRETSRRIETVEDVWLSMASDWGHQSVWTAPVAFRLLQGVGFEVEYSRYGISKDFQLAGIDGRHLSEGLVLAEAETSVLEATRR